MKRSMFIDLMRRLVCVTGGEEELWAGQELRRLENDQMEQLAGQKRWDRLENPMKL